MVLGWGNPATLPAAQTNHSDATFAFTATGQTSLGCRLDGVDLAGCTSPVVVTGLADGTHSFDVVANPGTGTQVVLRASWTVDTVAPPAPVVTGPSGPVASTSATVTVSAAEGGDVLTCVLDGGASGCGPTLSLTGLAQGSHAFTATASDAAGNTAPAALAWTVDTVAPTAVVTVPVQVESAATVAFNEPVTSAGSGGVVLRTSVGAAVAATATCRNDSSVVVPCSGTTVRSVVLQPAHALVPGEYYQVLVDPAGTTPVTDIAGNAAVATVKAFRAAVSLQETSKAAVLSWHKVVAAAAKGGSYMAEHRAGASASWSFSGTSVTWLTETGRPFGLATVYVDGVKRMTANNYSSVTRYGVARTVSGLAAGTHKVTVVVAGLKGSRGGADTQVSVDGFRVGTVLYATPALVTTWRHLSAAKALGAGVRLRRPLRAGRDPGVPRDRHHVVLAAHPRIGPGVGVRRRPAAHDGRHVRRDHSVPHRAHHHRAHQCPAHADPRGPRPSPQGRPRQLRRHRRLAGPVAGSLTGRRARRRL